MKKIENIFKEAEEIAENLEIEDIDEEEKNITLSVAGYEIEESIDPELLENKEIFEIKELKKDFIICKRTLYTIIRKGQQILSSAPCSTDELKASEIAALAQLSEVISKQLKMIVEMYKDIQDIELKIKQMQSGINVPEGSNFTQNNNNVFVGRTDELMDIINNRK